MSPQHDHDNWTALQADGGHGLANSNDSLDELEEHVVVLSQHMPRKGLPHQDASRSQLTALGTKINTVLTQRPTAPREVV